MSADNPLQMLQNVLKELPQTSGVYEFFDSHQRLLYIGKAKNLRKRVQNYFKQSPQFAPSSNLSPRVYKMIQETQYLRYLLTNSEQDALILENSLIKQLKPKYNILLRDDKTYPYIYYNPNEDFPRFDITRKILHQKHIRYFGPYTIGAKEILDSLYEFFPLVQKKACLHSQKSCLFYQIKRCPAPCEQKITKEEYATHFKKALQALQKPSIIIQLLTSKMQQLAQSLRFEEAQKIKERINKIKYIKHYSQIDIAKSENIDIAHIWKDNGHIILMWLYMRNGKIVSHSHEIFKDKMFDEEEIFKQSIINRFSQPMPITPTEILLPRAIADKELLQNYLKEHCQKDIKIHSPTQSSKKKLLELCMLNAKENLKIHLQESINTRDIAYKIQELFNLQDIPYRIECFDTSHFQKQSPVGAMVVFEDNNFIKKDYRHYKLEGLNEYAQMREMLTRRCLDFKNNPPPDLWLLDGGIGQINIAQELIKHYGANTDILAISKEKLDSKAHRSKGASKDILWDISHKPYALQPTDLRLQFFQRIRDEAHRFAISYHRKKKRKEDINLKLLEIKGLGQQKLKALLAYFGTFDAIAQASTEELTNIVGQKIAQQIKDYCLHSQAI